MTILKEAFAWSYLAFSSALQTTTAMRQTEFRLRYHESKTEILRMPVVTCLARFIKMISVKLPGETSFQLKRLLDISSYLSREEKQFTTRRTQIVAFTPDATELGHSYLNLPSKPS